jgi:RimJ/RimL family protein N-acetyltransferase
MLSMPLLETTRLHIRPLQPTDLADIHRILDVDLADADFGSQGAQSLQVRRRWLEWTLLGYQQQALLYQPPYGERAVVLKTDERLIGAVGFAPSLGPFGQLDYFRHALGLASAGHFTAEVGLYWAISPHFQRQGFASEAAQAMIDDGFGRQHLSRLVATTTYDNLASIGVMRKLGMRIERNPFPEPPWFQVVGVLENT